MKNGINPQPRKYFKKTSFFKYHLGDVFKMPKASIELNLTFDEILQKRQSIRNFKNLSPEQISSLLWYALKVKKVFVSKEGKIITHRNPPSAGGIHPIDVFISTPNIISKRYLEYYNPFTHSLAKLETNRKLLLSFFNIINENLPLKNATLIWFVAHSERTNAKYINPNSLIWRDSGALLMTIQLVATGLNLNTCPLGTLAEPMLSNLFEKPNSIFSCGGILVG